MTGVLTAQRAGNACVSGLSFLLRGRVVYLLGFTCGRVFSDLMLLAFEGDLLSFLKSL